MHQVFEGEITGRALLIFPEERSLELVRAVVGSELSLEEIIELEQEALAETGNIILNSCLATIANSLESNLKISLPGSAARRKLERFFSLEPPPAAGTTVMFIYINFAMQRRDINGYIAMMMDMPSLAALQTLLRALIRRTGGASRRRTDAGDAQEHSILDGIAAGLIVARHRPDDRPLERVDGLGEPPSRGGGRSARPLEQVFPDDRHDGSRPGHRIRLRRRRVDALDECAAPGALAADDACGAAAAARRHRVAGRRCQRRGSASSKSST